ncbi:hypothetical protein U2H24_19675 [Bacillus cereus]|uniref:tetratricopeptide repeat protein n=1 Tax=Bacillus cereus TaxID=1396 RepID=UPI002ADECEE8|nr:hypothetical protein [Bacillus cereus]MEA1011859.1 hypothetical protein [Bacillus cereus]
MLLKIIGAVGGVVFAAVIIILVVIILFKKQLNPFFLNLLKLRYKDFEIERKFDNDIDSKNSATEEKSVQTETIQQDAAKEISSAIDEDVKSKNDNLIDKLFAAYQDKNTIEMKKIQEEMLYNAEDIEERLKLEALYHCLLYRLGKDTSQKFKDLEEKAIDKKAYLEIMSAIGNCYKETTSYEIAETYYQKGLLKAKELKDEHYICSFTKQIADCYFIAKKKSQGYDTLMSALKEDKNLENHFNYYEKLADFYRQDNDMYLYTYMLEKALEIKPNHKETLFSIAHAYYGDLELNDVSAIYYERLLKLDNTNSSALNNMGVTYNSLGLKSKGIENYKKAIALNNTLASANLAYVHMGAGLVEEAEMLLKDAYTKENAHPNVHEASAALDKQRKAEEELESKALAEGEKVQQFYQNALTRKLEKTESIAHILQGKWKLDDKYTYEIQVVNNCIEITKDKEKFSGHFTNKYFDLKHYTQGFSFSSNEAPFEEKGTVQGYLLEDNVTILLLKVNKYKHRTYHKLTKETT